MGPKKRMKGGHKGGGGGVRVGHTLVKDRNKSRKTPDAGWVSEKY